jgi:cytoskeletal protein RodZ
MKNKFLVLFMVGILMSSFLATTVKANNAKFASAEKNPLKTNTVSTDLEVQNNNDLENENNTVEDESNENNEIEDKDLASPVDNISSPTPNPTTTPLPSPSTSPSPTADNTMALIGINNNPQNNQKTLGKLLRQMMDMIKRILATN